MVATSSPCGRTRCSAVGRDADADAQCRRRPDLVLPAARRRGGPGRARCHTSQPIGLVPGTGRCSAPRRPASTTRATCSGMRSNSSISGRRSPSSSVVRSRAGCPRR
jgi:hypothetical protein